MDALEELNAGAHSVTTAVGYQAGHELTSGIHNVFIGGYAGDRFTDADYNVAIGYQALTADRKGNRSTAVGMGSLLNQDHSTSTDACNTAVGCAAGNQITTGVNNVCIGELSAAPNDDMSGEAPLTTGNNNVLVGVKAQVSAADADAQVVLGFECTGASDTSLTFGKAATDSNIDFGATSITAPSDVRLKEDIQDEKVGLDFINELRPVTFLWKKAKDVPSEMKVHDPDSEERVMNGKHNHGFIAQEVKEAIDKYDIKEGFDMWKEDDADGRQRVAPSALIPMLVKAIQELSAEVTKLKGE